jgi:hypothetical protein
MDDYRLPYLAVNIIVRQIIFVADSAKAATRIVVHRANQVKE